MEIRFLFLLTDADLKIQVLYINIELVDNL